MTTARYKNDSLAARDCQSRYDRLRIGSLILGVGVCVCVCARLNTARIISQTNSATPDDQWPIKMTKQPYIQLCTILTKDTQSNAFRCAICCDAKWKKHNNTCTGIMRQYPTHAKSIPGLALRNCRSTYCNHQDKGITCQNAEPMPVCVCVRF